MHHILQEGLAGLDYGTMRVCDSKSLPLVFKNTGKYPVSYAFTLRNAQVRKSTEKSCKGCFAVWEEQAVDS
eukprot:scaffold80291_cov14-Tisochrysis_lutea.AAC.1